MQRTIHPMFLAVVIAGALLLAGSATSMAQNEGSIRIRARILPSSQVGVGSGQQNQEGSGTQLEPGDEASDGTQAPGQDPDDSAQAPDAQAADQQPQADQQPGDGAATAVTEDEGVDTQEDGVDEARAEDSGEEDRDRTEEAARQPRTRTMSIQADNSVLVQVQQDQDILNRQFLEFGAGGDQVGYVDVGTLERNTTVDILHMSI